MDYQKSDAEIKIGTATLFLTNFLKRMLQGVIRGRISPDGFPALGRLGGAGSQSGEFSCQVAPLMIESAKSQREAGEN